MLSLYMHWHAVIVRMHCTSINQLVFFIKYKQYITVVPGHTGENRKSGS